VEEIVHAAAFAVVDAQETELGVRPAELERPVAVAD
jgi:hypothetical protein